MSASSNGKLSKSTCHLHPQGAPFATSLSRAMQCLTLCWLVYSFEHKFKPRAKQGLRPNGCLGPVLWALFYDSDLRR